MENARLAVMISNWFYKVDPFNGCPEDELRKSTLLLLRSNPGRIIEEIETAIDEYGLMSPTCFCSYEDEAKELITLLRAE